MDLIDWPEVTAHDQRAAYYHEVGHSIAAAHFGYAGQIEVKPLMFNSLEQYRTDRAFSGCFTIYGQLDNETQRQIIGMAGILTEKLLTCFELEALDLAYIGDTISEELSPSDSQLIGAIDLCELDEKTVEQCLSILRNNWQQLNSTVEQYLGFTQHKEELQQVLEHIKRLELSHASDSQNTI